jgi:hypothetical protein
MDLLIVGLLALGTFATGVVGNLIASEFYDRAPSLAKWLITRAAQGLVEPDRTRYLEEWRAHLEECPGNLGKLWHAFGCCVGAPAMTNELRKLAVRRAGKATDNVVADKTNSDSRTFKYGLWITVVMTTLLLGLTFYTIEQTRFAKESALRTVERLKLSDIEKKDIEKIYQRVNTPFGRACVSIDTCTPQ